MWSCRQPDPPANQEARKDGSVAGARDWIITPVAGNGRWGNSGDDGPALEATLAGPAGIAVVPDTEGKLTLFIADFYNGRVRAVGPDGIIRALSSGNRDGFGMPTRVAYGTTHGQGWLYVTDPNGDRIVALSIPRVAPNLARARP